MKLTLNLDALAVESFSIGAGGETNEWTGGAQAGNAAMPTTTIASRPVTVCCVDTV